MNARTVSILSAALRMAQTRLSEFQRLPHMADPPGDREIDELCAWLDGQSKKQTLEQMRLAAMLEMQADEA